MKRNNPTQETPCNFNPEDLATASIYIDACLSETTGLGDYERTLIAYFCIATYALPHLNTFPMLTCIGPMGTGKSSALEVVNRFARNPLKVPLRGRTMPVIRDTLAECYEGTAIIEEGDSAWSQGNVEALFSDRCQRDTAETGRKKPSSDGQWENIIQPYFGASAIHRRIPFSDAALAGRSITIRFRANRTKGYSHLDQDLAEEGRQLLDGIDLYLPDVKPLEGVAPRIWDFYRPIAAVAQMLDNEDFLSTLTKRLQTESLSLREAQETEPEALVLQALLQNLGSDEKGDLDFSQRIPYSAIVDSIWKTEHMQLRPHQVGGVFRELGFKTVKSHGVSKVEATPATLLTACEQLGIEDDTLDALRAKMQKHRDRG